MIENLKTNLLETEKKVPSEDEKKLIEYKNKIKESQEKFRQAEMKKIEAEKEMKKHSNFEECFKSQIDRVVNGQESLLDYCEKNFQKKDLTISKTETVEKPIAQKTRKVVRNDWNEDDKRQDYINYIYERAGKQALLTFTGENTFWTIDRPSTETGFDGQRAYGFCQLYYRYHKDFIDSKEFYDPYKQLDYCIGVWNDAKKRGILATTFQAYPGRNKWIYLFKFM